MKTFLLSTILILSIYALGYAGISISGPSTVCPYQEYTFEIDVSFILGQCGSTQWTIKNSNGAIVASGFGDTITYAFPSPDKEVYSIRASASGGLGCFNWYGVTKYVTTVYPKPRIIGPGKLCAGGTGVFTPTVNATGICFHHKIDWKVPAGWGQSISSSGQLILTVPSSAQNKYYILSARVWYNDRNEFGDYQNKSIWIGKPATIVAIPNGVPAIQAPLFSWVNINAASTGASTYNWWVNNSSALSLISNNGTIATIECMETGRYYVYVNSANSCGTSTNMQIPIDVTTGGGGLFSGGKGGGQYRMANETDLESEIASSELEVEVDNSLIYPNPANDEITVLIKNSNNEVPASIYLVDLKGQVVLTKTVSESETTLNVSDFDDGIYFVRIKNEYGIIIKKLIIQN